MIVVTLTGNHNFASTRTFESREACESYARDTRLVVNDSKYVLDVRFRCKARGLPL
jgi:hypothetical protein